METQLQRYEELIRAATDNKLTAQGAWGVALIDYFHEMAIEQSKNGERINFQQASSALDGCVRVYAQRVDSAASETVRILAGLTSSTKLQERDDDLHDSNDNDDPNSVDSGNQKKSKRRRRDTQSTLFNCFDKFKIKDSERSTNTDPIFKRSLTDFDEGGARSLLNNILPIDPNGRVTFNTITENDSAAKWEKVNFNHFKEILKDDSSFGDLSELNVVFGGKTNQMDDKNLEDIKDDNVVTHDDEIIVDDAINVFEFNRIIDFDFTDTSTVCPSIQSLKGISTGAITVGDIAQNLQSMPLINTELYNNTERESFALNGEFDNDEIPIFEPHEQADEDEDHEEMDVTDISKRTHYSLFLDDNDDDENNSQPNLTLTKLSDEHLSDTPITNEDDHPNDGNFISLFDSLVNKALTTNGRSSKSTVYWKIRELRKEMRHHKIDTDNNNNNTQHLSVKRISQELDDDEEEDQYQGNEDQIITKSKTIIDFVGGPTDEDYTKLEPDDVTTAETLMFQQPQYLSRIILQNLTKNQRTDKFILDDDCSFTAKRLAYLSLKPKQIVNNILTVGLSKSSDKNLKFIDKERENMVANSTFFANKYQTDSNAEEIIMDNSNILNDENFDDMPDFEAWDLEEPVQFSQPMSSQQWSPKGNSQLSFSKKSKKVDIKLLKSNIWKSIEDQTITKKRPPVKQITKSGSDPDESSSTEVSSSDDDLDPNSYLEKHAITELKFTEVVKGAVTKYSGETKVELSTSYCFISLLHLANEQGMILTSTDLNDDIIIRK